MHKSSGFTLIEVLVIISIIAVMSSVVWMMTRGWIPSSRLRTAADDLTNNLQLAKMNAIRSDNSFSVKFDAAGQTYSVVEKASGGDSTVKTVRLGQYGSGVAFGEGNATVNAADGGGIFPSDGVDYSNPDDEVVFNSRGMIDDNNLGWIYIQNDLGAAFAIGTPSIAGVVRLRYCKQNQTSWH